MEDDIILGGDIIDIGNTPSDLTIEEEVKKASEVICFILQCSYHEWLCTHKIEDNKENQDRWIKETVSGFKIGPHIDSNIYL